ncbi:glycosyltransferase family 1 protein [Sphingobacterium sp.]|uniref:glycosyltransferase family 4 protein n=1 Tax=Sphingobacterium sp. TaxID=341027 RepID=UPI0031E00F07
MIYINGRFLTQSITGVGRFALEICKSLLSRGIEFTLLVPRKYQNVLENPNGFNIKFVGLGDSHIWEQVSLWWFISRQKDVLLLSFTGLGPVFYKNKITTIHDLSFFHEPKWFSKGYYYFYKFFTPIAAKYCRQILTVSEFSKAEIIKYLNINPGHVTVVYNGNSFTESYDKRNDGDKRFILGVSSLDPRKNHQLLLKAFVEVSKKTDLDLVLVGKAEKHFNFDFNMSEIDPARVHFTGYISDAELRKLYRKASLFVYPSLYEGFGIPPLEAIYYRCPILISDIPVFQEIFHESAIFFDPQSAADLEQKILLCLNNLDKIILSDEQRDFILEKFSWGKSALKIIELL